MAVGIILTKQEQMKCSNCILSVDQNISVKPFIQTRYKSVMSSVSGSYNESSAIFAKRDQAKNKIIVSH